MKRSKQLIVAIILGVIIFSGIIWISIGRFWKRELSPRGGAFFFKRVELQVQQFLQADEKWENDPLGATQGTLGREGCAVTSAAMVLNYHHIDTDPQRLNIFLTNHAGYTDEGWIYWEKAAELAPSRVKRVYENLPSYQLIDSNLLKKNPVIVRLRFPNQVTHFVVIMGKQGFDYLIRDPGAGARKGIYPLREFGSKIEALRFYEFAEK